MAVTLSDKVENLTQLLDTLQAGDILVLDLRQKCNWTDYMVIATTRSLVHLRGVVTQIERRCLELDLPLRRPRVEEGQTWALCDAGQVVLQLMERSCREFYRLEDLYFDSPAFNWQAAPRNASAMGCSHGG